MSYKRWAIAIVTATAVASLGITSPAGAQQDCVGWGFSPAPGPNTVSVENGQLRINPGGVGADIEQYLAYVDPYADKVGRCVGGLIPPEVFCVINNALEIIDAIDPVNGDLRYVYQDPETGELVVDYGLLLSDITACP